MTKGSIEARYAAAELMKTGNHGPATCHKPGKQIWLEFGGTYRDNQVWMNVVLSHPCSSSSATEQRLRTG